MTSLFEPVTAGALHLKNRIVMAPLTRNRSPNAVPTPLAITYYAQRATAGLLVTEATAISHQGQGYADVPGLYAPEQLAAWKRVTEAVHAAGGCIVTQLWHVGRVSHTELQPDGAAPVAPSAITAKTKTVLIHDGVPAFVDTSPPRALRLDELPGIVDDYRRAAKAASRSTRSRMPIRSGRCCSRSWAGSTPRPAAASAASAGASRSTGTRRASTASGRCRPRRSW